MNHNQWLKANPRNSAHGAPMGHYSDVLDESVKVHVERLDWIDGDYTRDGTYHGRMRCGDYIFAIWQDVGGERLAMYFRGTARAEAVDYAVEQGLTPLRGKRKGRKDEPTKRPDRTPRGPADSRAPRR